MSSKTKTMNAIVLSEAPGTRSRSKVVLASGTAYVAGDVLGKVTASGKLTLLAPAANDGSQTAAAVLLDTVDCTSADGVGTVIDMDAELVEGGLGWRSLTTNQKATARGQLLSLGIKIRTEMS